jgi:hypothetical protein
MEAAKAQNWAVEPQEKKNSELPLKEENFKQWKTSSVINDL